MTASVGCGSFKQKWSLLMTNYTMDCIIHGVLNNTNIYIKNWVQIFLVHIKGCAKHQPERWALILTTKKLDPALYGLRRLGLFNMFQSFIQEHITSRSVRFTNDLLMKGARFYTMSTLSKRNIVQEPQWMYNKFIIKKTIHWRVTFKKTPSALFLLFLLANMIEQLFKSTPLWHGPIYCKMISWENSRYHCFFFLQIGFKKL